MSDLDALISRSRDPGQFAERQEFTLSRDKAIEKMREFTLRHPKQYVLELVQAAVFAGASWVAVDVTADAMLLGYVGGKTLQRRELENIFDYLFADQADIESRHLMQLAIGLNAILQRNPKVIRIESGEGTQDTTVRMDMDSEGNGEVGIPDEPLAGTYVMVEFQRGWFARFTGGTGGDEESALVETRCLYTPVPILLNGDAPFGFRAQRKLRLFGVRAQHHFEGDGRRGVLGVAPANMTPEFRLIVGGVWVSSRRIDALGHPLTGVICDNRLRKTADMSDVVQDERWVAMLHAVQPTGTTALKERNADYAAPRLPKLELPKEVEKKPGVEVAPIAPPEAVAEPLPDDIPQLGEREATTMAKLAKLPARTPLFWVSPESATELEASVDPELFPYRVLTLTEGQAVTVEQGLSVVSPNRLATPADAGFVTNMLTRRDELREATIDLKVPGLDIDGKLTLRLHLAGRLPAWGDGRWGVPAIVTNGERTVLCTSLPAIINDVSAVFVVPGLKEVDAAARAQIETALTDAVIVESWRLLPLDQSLDSDPRYRPLLCSLLALHSRPYFVETDGVTTLHASLPDRWEEARDRLRDATLAETTTGPLTLKGFLALQGTGDSAPLRRSEDLRALHGLEAIYGFGHLSHSEVSREPLFAVGLVGNRWVRMKPGMWSVEFLRAAIWLQPTFGTTEDPMPGWHDGDKPHPVFVAKIAPDRAPEDRMMWRGWQYARQVLSGIEGQSNWEEEAPEGITPERLRAVVRVGLFSIANWLGQSDQVYLTDSAGVQAAVDDASRTAPLRYAALNGVHIAEAGTVQLTHDELTALQGAQRDGSPSPRRILRFDDAPEVWQSLDDGTDGWLLRQEVRMPGLEGWLGLRHPFDSTSGVLVETSRSVAALPELDQRLPCHGLVWMHGGGHELTDGQLELLQLAGLQLYQQLAELLRGRVSSDPLATGIRYARRFARLAHHNAGDQLGGTAMDLARSVPVNQASGEEWGSLEDWFNANPDARPALPELPIARRPTVDVPDAEHDIPGPVAELGDRLERALSAFVNDVRVTIYQAFVENESPIALDSLEKRHPRKASFTLNPEHDLVIQALSEDRQALELLLLASSRVAHRWARSNGHRVDFLELQRVIVAQRLQRGVGWERPLS